MAKILRPGGQIENTKGENSVKNLPNLTFFLTIF